MALAATLVLETFALATDAFAVFDELGTYALKIDSKGSASCQINGDDCRDGKIKTAVRALIVVDDENPVNGFAQLQTSVKISGMGNLKLKGDGLPYVLGNPSDAVPPAGLMVIQGELQGKRGLTALIEMTIENIDFQAGTGNCSSTITVSNGTPSSSHQIQVGVA